MKYLYPIGVFNMEVTETDFPGLYTIKPTVHEDGRGFFCETYRKDTLYPYIGDVEFKQDNHSRSSKGVLRGLHFQWQPKMAKLMRVTSGAAFLVAVDIRKGSPTLGMYYGEIVSADNKLQILAPSGFARGFYSLTDTVEIQYKCTGVYNKNFESGIAWDCVDIDWPFEGDPILSSRDTGAPTLEDWLYTPESDNFTYADGKFE